MLQKVKVDTQESYEENSNENDRSKEDDNGSTLAKLNSEIFRSQQKVRTIPRDSYEPRTTELGYTDSVEEESIIKDGKAKTFHGLQQFNVDQLESLEHDSIEQDRNSERFHEKTRHPDITDSPVQVDTHDSHEDNTNENDITKEDDNGSTLAKFNSDIFRSEQEDRTSQKDSYEPSTNEIDHTGSVEEDSILMKGKPKTFHGLQQFNLNKLDSLENESIEKDRNSKSFHEESRDPDNTDTLSSESRSDMKMREYDHYEQNSFEDDSNDSESVGSENLNVQQSRKPKVIEQQSRKPRVIEHDSSKLDTKEDSGSVYENLGSNELGNVIGRFSAERSPVESGKDSEEVTKPVKVDIKQGVSKIDETIMRSNADPLNRHKSTMPVAGLFSSKNIESNNANFSNHGDPDFYFHGRYTVYVIHVSFLP